MATLLLNSSATLPSLALGLRLWLARLGALIDRAVSARALRTVPEWQMQQVEVELRRHLKATNLQCSEVRPGCQGSFGSHADVNHPVRPSPLWAKGGSNDVASPNAAN